MKLLKNFGALLLCLGCIAAAIGILALILPGMDNSQVQKLLEAFREPSEHFFVSLVNAIMTCAIENCYTVLFGGAGAVMVGAAIILFSRRTDSEDSYKQYEQTEPHGGAQKSEAAYKVADSDIDAADVKVWHQNGGSPAEEVNPFADASLVSILTPKTEAKPPENTTNPFALTASKPESAPSAYKRPEDGHRNSAESYTPPIIEASHDPVEAEHYIYEHIVPQARVIVRQEDAQIDESISKTHGRGEAVPPAQKPSIKPLMESAPYTEHSNDAASAPRVRYSTPRTDKPHGDSPIRQAMPKSIVKTSINSNIDRAERSHLKSAADERKQLHLSTPMLPPIAPKSEETLFRAPDFTLPKGDERPRIRSTFRSSEPIPAPAPSSDSAAGKAPVKPRIKITVGKR